MQQTDKIKEYINTLLEIKSQDEEPHTNLEQNLKEHTGTLNTVSCADYQNCEFNQSDQENYNNQTNHNSSSKYKKDNPNIVCRGDVNGLLSFAESYLTEIELHFFDFITQHAQDIREDLFSILDLIITYAFTIKMHIQKTKYAIVCYGLNELSEVNDFTMKQVIIITNLRLTLRKYIVLMYEFVEIIDPESRPEWLYPGLNVCYYVPDDSTSAWVIKQPIAI